LKNDAKLQHYFQFCKFYTSTGIPTKNCHICLNKKYIQAKLKQKDFYTGTFFYLFICKY